MDLRDPWLVAVWPGMGKVALTAGNYLIETLEAEFLLEVPCGDHFELEGIRVHQGVVLPARLPRNRFYGWKNPAAEGRDLLIFVGDAQPSHASYEFGRSLIQTAVDYGVQRVFTFAAMLTAAAPSSAARVFAVATDQELLRKVRAHGKGVGTLELGEITGLNGTLLGAALAEGLDGVCLLGELPQIARNLSYPKASLVVLGLFSRMLGIDLDLEGLDVQAESVEQSLSDLMSRIQGLVGNQGEAGISDASEEQPSWLPPSSLVQPEEEPEPNLDPGVEQRIEDLFDGAARDRSKALELKDELDRLGLFKRYEDRFLDLFKG